MMVELWMSELSTISICKKKLHFCEVSSFEWASINADHNNAVIIVE